MSSKLTSFLNCFQQVGFTETSNRLSSMVAKDHQNVTNSPNPKAEVGEIDTSAPFQSVKDAVTLFGEGAFSGEKHAIKKAKQHSAEVFVVLLYSKSYKAHM